MRDRETPKRDADRARSDAEYFHGRQGMTSVDAVAGKIREMFQGQPVIASVWVSGEGSERTVDVIVRTRQYVEAHEYQFNSRLKR